MTNILIVIAWTAVGLYSLEVDKEDRIWERIKGC